jgi:hypothetical protein
MGTTNTSSVTRSYRAAISMALGFKPFYQGTVDPAAKAERRAKNKRARAARRLHRKAGQR